MKNSPPRLVDRANQTVLRNVIFDNATNGTDMLWLPTEDDSVQSADENLTILGVSGKTTQSDLAAGKHARLRSSLQAIQNRQGAAFDVLSLHSYRGHSP